LRISNRRVKAIINNITCQIIIILISTIILFSKNVFKYIYRHIPTFNLGPGPTQFILRSKFLANKNITLLEHLLHFFSDIQSVWTCYYWQNLRTRRWVSLDNITKFWFAKLCQAIIVTITCGLCITLRQLAIIIDILNYPY